MERNSYQVSASNANEEGGDPNILEGTVVAGSYDPVGFWNGSQALPTIEVTIGEDYSASTNGTTINTRRAVMATPQIGDQYGPTGGERVTLMRSRSYWVAMFLHGPDDSPQTPAGERRIGLRNPDTGKYDLGFMKLLLDGGTPGDGLGGFSWTGQFAALGGEFAALGPEAAAFTRQYIQDLVDSMMADMQQSLVDQISAALVAASAGATTPTQQAIAFQAAVTIANWVVDNVTPPTIGSGTAGIRLHP